MPMVACECVIADTIGGVADAPAEDVSTGRCRCLLTSPLLVLQNETIDMDPLRPKAIWGFNGRNDQVPLFGGSLSSP